MESKVYRHDVNALRALAVIAVVLYHMGYSALNGGFIGVDVFFVISGYLMTGIVIRGLELENFSLLDYYKSRARRIAPALSLVCIAALVVGFFIAIPKDYFQLSKHSLSSLLFFSNVTYMMESSYFDASSHDKWLLHTWSLSVEWQFYLAYPIILITSQKLIGLRGTKILVTALTALLLAVSIFATSKWPTNSFYLAPTRAWEMLIGGLVYIWAKPSHSFNRAALSFAGAITILASILLLNDSIAWPSLISLVPVLATCAVLFAGHQDSFIYRNALVRTIGNQSYSIYLWHWLIIAVAAYFEKQLNPFFFAAVLAFLSWLSYTWLEEKRPTMKATALWVSVATILSGTVMATDGAAWRTPEQFQLSASEYHEKYYGGSGYKGNGYLSLGSDKGALGAIVIGDSYALQYAQSLDQSGKNRNVKFEGIFDHGCFIARDYTRFIKGIEDIQCASQYEKAIALLANDKSAPVIIAYAWNIYQTNLGHKGAQKALQMTQEDYLIVLQDQIRKLITDGGDNRSYYIIGAPQPAATDVFKCAAKSHLPLHKVNSACTTTEPRTEDPLNKALERIAASVSNLHYVSTAEALCSADGCLVADENSNPIHSDRSHLSIFGAEKVTRMILTQLNLD